MNRDIVKEYYGKTLTASADLRTDACTTASAPPLDVRRALGGVHEAVAARYYGCGLVIPPVLAGLSVLDLGCGAGRDVFAISKLVGESGRVVGVDMTTEQLAVARAHEAWHADSYGYRTPNTRFVEGYLEELDALDLAPASFDLIISNCVINLCTDKPAVFRAAHKLLKPGGEMFFSDIYADRRIPAALAQDPLLYGECLSGALYWGDYVAMAKQAGFVDPRVFDHRPLRVIDPSIIEKTASIRFASVTARLFKLGGIDPACEDYGQAVIYRGGVAGMERVFNLDSAHAIEAGRIFPVCGNTLAMLTHTRFAPYFETIGDGSRHFGLFPGCKTPDIFASSEATQPAAVGSCC